MDASDPDFPFGEGNDRPTADAHTRCIRHTGSSSPDGDAPPPVHGWTVPRHAGAADDVAVERNRIGGLNHVRPVRCVVRVWCDQSDVVGSRRPGRPGRPARALRIPAAHRVVQVAPRGARVTRGIKILHKSNCMRYGNRMVTIFLEGDRPWSKSTCSV